MREIKFRGLHTFMGVAEWVYGYYFPNSTGTFHHIYLLEERGSRVVNGETVGEVTDAQDKHLNAIYEHDIVSIDTDDDPLIGVVRRLKGGQWYIDHPKVSLKYAHQIHCEVCETSAPVFFIDFYDHYELEVIGNIYEHPELLK